jgi:hypothetical protein
MGRGKSATTLVGCGVAVLAATEGRPSNCKEGLVLLLGNEGEDARFKLFEEEVA